MSRATIEKVSNGYIVTSFSYKNETHVFGTLDEALQFMLAIFESRHASDWVDDKYYGKVTINRDAKVRS